MILKTALPIHYRVSIGSIAGHLFNVTLRIDQPDAEGQILALPAWIPGSYMIRDFAKNIVTLTAQQEDGQQLQVVKLDKQRWQLAASTAPVYVHYQVYAFDLSVRSAYLSDDYGFANGTSLFLQVMGQHDTPIGVEFIAPSMLGCEHWQLVTAMPRVDDNFHHFGQFHCVNYAELIDHPVLMGHYDIVDFEAKGVNFELILCGGHQADTSRIAHDLSRIAEQQISLFGEAPVKRYLFLTLLTHNGFGGLEHSASTALLFSRDDLPGIEQANTMPDGYRTFLSLCSHELFHTWHVKRIKPKALASAQLDREVYTEQLWIYEGFTSYYDDLYLHRSGLIDANSYLELVGQNLTRLLRNQGRLKQTVTESSFDAWTRFYQQDASAVNNIVSYYNKGSIIAMCLDLLMMHQSHGEFNLDWIMQQLWQLKGATGIATEKDIIQQLLAQQPQLHLQEFLHKALYTTDELPVQECLAHMGIELHLRASSGIKDKGGKAAKEHCLTAFGATYSEHACGVTITQVQQQTPAYEAGLQVGDHLIAIAGRQVSLHNLSKILDRLGHNQTVSLCLLRDQQLKQFSMAIQPAPLDTVYLSINDEAKASRWLTIAG